MQTKYRGRAFRLFAVNVHWLLRGLWQVAKAMLDEFTLSKMHMHGGDFKENVMKIIDEKNLEEKYGGKLPNKTSNFFPPEMIWAR